MSRKVKPETIQFAIEHFDEFDTEKFNDKQGVRVLVDKELADARDDHKKYTHEQRALIEDLRNHETDVGHDTGYTETVWINKPVPDGHGGVIMQPTPVEMPVYGISREDLQKAKQSS